VHTWQCLQQKFIDHFPNDPYNISAIYEAVSYVLGAGPAASVLALPQAPTLPTTIPSPPIDQTSAKIEALMAVMTSLGEMFKTAIQSQPVGAKPQSTGVAATGISAPGNSNCNFCRGTGHFIWECKVMMEFIHIGKCKRSADGKVVLPSGAMVPCGITGTWLCDHIDEYHQQNLGQMAMQMLFEVAAMASVPPKDAAGQFTYGYPARYADKHYGDEAAQTLTMG